MNTHNMPFAGPLKIFVVDAIQSHPTLSQMLENQFGTKVTQEQVFSFFNDLKDNRSSGGDNNLSILEHDGKNYNVRMTLQALGSEILRSVDNNIHVKFIASQVLSILKKDPKSIIFMPDVRFKNEAMFVINFNAQPTVATKIAFCEQTISSELTLGDNCVFNADFSVNPNALKVAFKKHLGDIDASTFINHIYNNSLDTITTLSKSIKILPETNENPLSIPDTLKNISFDDAVHKGILKIFRPAFSKAGKHLDNVKSLDEAILKYSKTTQASLDLTKKLYADAGYEFNETTVGQFGLRRAPMLHISETDLDGYFPESFVNFPSGTTEAKKSVAHLSKLFIAILNQNINSGTFIVGGVGSAGHGKDYVIEILSELASNFDKVSPNNVSSSTKK